MFFVSGTVQILVYIGLAPLTLVFFFPPLPFLSCVVLSAAGKKNVTKKKKKNKSSVILSKVSS